MEPRSTRMAATHAKYNSADPVVRNFSVSGVKGLGAGAAAGVLALRLDIFIFGAVSATGATLAAPPALLIANTEKVTEKREYTSPNATTPKDLAI